MSSLLRLKKQIEEEKSVEEFVLAALYNKRNKKFPLTLISKSFPEIQKNIL